LRQKVMGFYEVYGTRKVERHRGYAFESNKNPRCFKATGISFQH
jgi:hypothetical protein